MKWLVLALVFAIASPAHAEDRGGRTAITHGVLVGELSIAGMFALNFGTDLPKHAYQTPVNLSPLVLAPAAGYGAYRARLDPRPALALHGALWAGADLMLLGALIDGRERAWQLRAGTAAWTLGGLGLVAGGLAGALAIKGDALLPWMVAPPLGFAAGGLVLGGVLVLVGGVDGDDALGQFATGAIVGTALGLGIAGVLAYTELGKSRQLARVARFVPQVTPGADRVVLSFGGTW